MNVVVVSGVLSADPAVRELKSGSVLVSFELTTRVDGVGISVPLVWFDPPKPVECNAGDAVRAVGTVRRRFYRAGGVTQSRTEVVVDRLALSSDKRAVAAQRKWLAAVLEADANPSIAAEPA